MPPRPRALIIRTAGTNCDAEMVRAFALAGAEPELVHLDRLIAEPARLDGFELIGFPGGFSYGDDIAAGRVLAVRIRERLYPALRAAAERGVLMIGACNGFQALVQTGLLPGCEPGAWPRERAPEQTVALAANRGARFIDAWVRVEPVAGTSCLWTRGLAEECGLQGGIKRQRSESHATPERRATSQRCASSEILMLPIAHGEGRFVAASKGVMGELERRGQVALRYGEDVNGSAARIAGICDPSGRIFGLMPHPERYLDWVLHPFWTRLPAGARCGDTPGLRMFKNAVEAVRAAGISGAVAGV